MTGPATLRTRTPVAAIPCSAPRCVHFGPSPGASRPERVESPPLPMDRTLDRAPLHWGWLLVPLAVGAFARGLWAPDEPRYAEVAREIFERRDFLVMHLCGDVYPDKPPLLFWIAGVLGWISGWSEGCMRIVSVLAT